MAGTEPHAWGTGRMDDITYVGLDVHKATVCVAVAEGGRGGEVRQIGVFENRPDILCKLAARLGKGGRRLSFCYEAGPCGYASIVGRWTNFADRRDVVAIEAKLDDDYEPNDQGVKVADVPVINAYRSPLDRTPPNKPNYHKSYGYLRTPELSNIVRAFS